MWIDDWCLSFASAIVLPADLRVKVSSALRKYFCVSAQNHRAIRMNGTRRWLAFSCFTHDRFRFTFDGDVFSCGNRYRTEYETEERPQRRARRTYGKQNFYNESASATLPYLTIMMWPARRINSPRNEIRSFTRFKRRMRKTARQRSRTRKCRDTATQSFFSTLIVHSKNDTAKHERTIVQHCLESVRDLAVALSFYIIFWSFIFRFTL